jgi:hypothetical protein
VVRGGRIVIALPSLMHNRCLQALKTLIFISLFFLWTSSYGQLDKLKGIWITPAQELIQIEDTGDLKENNYLSNAKLSDENFELYIYGDTLSFQKQYYSSATNYEKPYVDRYDLKVMKSNDTSIVVRPVSSLSKIFFQNKYRLTFTRQAFAVDTSIKFDKIIFHTTECFGTCPVYHLEVDKSKNVKLNSQIVYNPITGFQSDTASQGYFMGRLSDTTFEKLIKALGTCNLRTLKMKNALCCDGSIKTIIVYFNGQRKYFKTMFPPMIANEVVKTLFDICEKGGLKKTADKFKIEE